MVGAKKRVVFLAGAGCAMFLGEETMVLGEMWPAGPAYPAARTSRAGAAARAAGWQRVAGEKLGLPPGVVRSGLRARRLDDLWIVGFDASKQPGRFPSRKRRAAWRAAWIAHSKERDGPCWTLPLYLPARLSADQRAVFRLLARGLTNTQIAARLQRKRRWVCYQVAEIKRLLAVRSRAEIARQAVLQDNR